MNVSLVFLLPCGPKLWSYIRYSIPVSCSYPSHEYRKNPVVAVRNTSPYILPYLVHQLSMIEWIKDRMDKASAASDPDLPLKNYSDKCRRQGLPAYCFS